MTRIDAIVSQTRLPRCRERGTIIFIALIVLVAMSLAGIALMRSVDTANLIAGNLAFKNAIAFQGDTFWEELTCVGYNPALRQLTAVGGGFATGVWFPTSAPVGASVGGARFMATRQRGHRPSAPAEPFGAPQRGHRF